ncbi:MAG: hypothetical protein QNK33_07610, partial [Bacteroidales bacterium]|nr:hypothetical protein [Bacteroidales bacterium]
AQGPLGTNKSLLAEAQGPLGKNSVCKKSSATWKDIKNGPEARANFYIKTFFLIQNKQKHF